MQIGILLNLEVPAHEVGMPASTTTKLADLDPRNVGLKRGTFRCTQKQKEEHCEGLWMHEQTWAALLSKEQFLQLCEHYGFTGRSLCQSLGALGMPGGAWYGHSPAFVFESTDWGDATVQVWFTPWPEVERKSGISDSEKNWSLLEKVFRRLR